MRYLFLLVQHGQGCDYTIGCGKTWVELQARDVEDAINLFVEEYGISYTGDRSLQYIKIIEINESYIWHNPSFLTEDELEGWVDLGKKVRVAEEQVKKIREQNEAIIKKIAMKKLDIDRFVKSLKAKIE